MMVYEISKQNISIQSQVDIKPAASTNDKQQSVDTNLNKAEVVTLVDDAVTRLNKAMQSIERDLQFKVDENSGETIITVLDTKTAEVIRQIPTEEVLAIRENIETLKGILFSAKV